MNSLPPDSSDAPPIIDAPFGRTYTIEVLAQITGVSSQTILFYHEQGLVPATAVKPAEERTFDDEALRAVRRLEHLRTELGLKDPALKLMVNLLAEIERLRDEARARRG